ncbi:MAG: hypothetical protein ACI89L_001693 [Phycisphaerales bacterium]|jgi:hypothetical protein
MSSHLIVRQAYSLPSHRKAQPVRHLRSQRSEPHASWKRSSVRPRSSPLAPSTKQLKRSTGPRTPEGKARSRMNVWNHGERSAEAAQEKRLSHELLSGTLRNLPRSTRIPFGVTWTLVLLLGAGQGQVSRNRINQVPHASISETAHGQCNGIFRPDSAIWDHHKLPPPPSLLPPSQELKSTKPVGERLLPTPDSEADSEESFCWNFEEGCETSILITRKY